MPQEAEKGLVKKAGLSIVIPTFNGALWLPKTIDQIVVAVKKAGLQKYELIIINDGSTDDTVKVVEEHGKKKKLSIRIVSQKNSGRFVARQRGTDEAKYQYLLFVDTRVFIGDTSLQYISEKIQEDNSRKVWCSHVRVDKTGNIYARFWDAIAFVAWRKYFKNPKDISYSIDEFDDYPKGTTCFFIDKEVLKSANKWFVKNTKDLKTSNDDTLLIREIARNNSINVSPDFWCLYHARGSLKQYVKHVNHRGRVFVDGFLRNDGNRFFVPLIGFLALSLAVLVWLIFNPLAVLPLLAVGGILWLLELLLIILLSVPIKDGLSLFILTPIFAVFYGFGIWQAFIKINVLKKSGGA